MPEMAHADEDYGEAGSSAGFDHLIVVRAASRRAGSRPWRPSRPRSSARRLPASAAHSVDNLANWVDHELRLLLVYLVAAVRVGDVLRVRHEFGEPFLRLLLSRIVT
jgi:hypothetical protein